MTVRHGCRRHPARSGLTLIELMVTIAVAAILVALAAPSFRDLLIQQRLKSINSDLVTNIQFARSEAVSRNLYVSVKFQSGSSSTCYMVLVSGSEALCDCTTSPAIPVCSNSAEIRTVRVDNSIGVSVAIPSGQDQTFQYDPRTGGIRILHEDTAIPATQPFRINVDNDRLGGFVTAVEVTGRPTVCTPNAKMTGYTACP